MPFAVEVYFDAQITEAVAGLEARLDELGTGPSLRGLGFAPHMSLATCSELDEDAVRHVIREVARTRGPLPISLEAVGAFPPEGAIVFLAPGASLELLELHSTIWNALQSAASELSPYYQPGRWVPHLTVAQGVPPAARARVLAVVAAAGLPLRGSVVAIGLTGYRAAVQAFRFPFTG